MCAQIIYFYKNIVYLHVLLDFDSNKNKNGKNKLSFTC